MSRTHIWVIGMLAYAEPRSERARPAPTPAARNIHAPREGGDRPWWCSQSGSRRFEAGDQQRLLTPSSARCRVREGRFAAPVASLPARDGRRRRQPRVGLELVEGLPTNITSNGPWRVLAVRRGPMYGGTVDNTWATIRPLLATVSLASSVCRLPDSKLGRRLAGCVSLTGRLVWAAGHWPPGSGGRDTMDDLAQPHPGEVRAE